MRPATTPFGALTGVLALTCATAACTTSSDPGSGACSLPRVGDVGAFCRANSGTERTPVMPSRSASSVHGAAAR